MSENTPQIPNEQGGVASGGYGGDTAPVQDSAQAQRPPQQGVAPTDAAPPSTAQSVPPVQDQSSQGQPHLGAPPTQPSQSADQVPGQPPYLPTAPNPAVTALKSTWDALLDVLSSKPGDAHNRLAASGLWGWVIPNALQAIVSSLFLTQVLLTISNAMAYFIRSFLTLGASSTSLYSTPVVPLGRIILAFIILALAIFGIQVLRGMQLMLTARIGKVPASFSASMHAVSVSVMPLIPVYLMLNLLILFSGTLRSADGLFFLMLLVVLLLSFGVFSGEVLIYLSLNRLGRSVKSPIIMHALLSTAWVLASLITYYVAVRLMG